jgi:DNA polymerase III subunit beta
MSRSQAGGVEFTVNKEHFLKEIALVRGAAEKKTTIPILANILLEVEGETITLAASDLELSIRSTCPARVRHSGSGTIPARKLFDYFKLLPEGDVLVRFESDHWAGVNGGRNRARIAGMSRESFPALPDVPEPIATLQLASLNSLISRVSFAISTEESRFTLNGALLLIGSGAMTMVATDGHRLSFACVSSDASVTGTPLRVLLPKRAMSEISKLSAGAKGIDSVQLSIDDNHLFFQIGHRLLITRKLTGNFPDYERVLPKDHPHVAQLERAGMQSAIARVSQFADGTSHAMRAQFKAGELRVFASCVDSGESEEAVPCEYTGPEMEMGFNSRYLLDFLSATTSARVSMLVKDVQSAGELKPGNAADGDEYRYVVMPMRV